MVAGRTLAALPAVAAAAGLSCAELGRVVAHYLDRLDPDGPEPDPTEHRSFTLVRPGARLRAAGEIAIGRHPGGLPSPG